MMIKYCHEWQFESGYSEMASDLRDLFLQMPVTRVEPGATLVARLDWSGNRLYEIWASNVGNIKHRRYNEMDLRSCRYHFD